MKWKNRLVFGLGAALFTYEAWSQWTSGRVRIGMGSNLIKIARAAPSDSGSYGA